jgi:hypothetical protein
MGELKMMDWKNTLIIGVLLVLVLGLLYFNYRGSDDNGEIIEPSIFPITSAEASKAYVEMEMG